jgi:hypothetical protein
LAASLDFSADLPKKKERVCRVSGLGGLLKEVILDNNIEDDDNNDDDPVIIDKRRRL